MFTSLAADPTILKREFPEMVRFLHRQGTEGAQGTGNIPTHQEASFATYVAARGFTFQAKRAAVPPDGLYYLYQLKGSQAEGDFGLREYKGGEIIAEVVVDLKHTRGKTFYLNDGWFLKNVVYIVSWNAGTPKKPVLRTHIALGQDIPTEEENSFMTSLRAFRTDKNKNTNKIGSLRPYVRFGNQYACTRFTSEKAAEDLTAVEAYLK